MFRKITILWLTAILVGLGAGCSNQIRKSRHLARADSYFSAGKFTQAEIEYLNVVKLDIANAHAMARLGMIYYEEGRPVRAYPFIMKALELGANEPGLHCKAGRLYFAVGDLKNALQQANTALKESPDDVEAALLLADCARVPSDQQLIRKQLLQSQQGTGAAAAADVALGTLDMKSGDLGAASATFSNALILNPKSAAAHYAMGTLYWAQNNLTNADAEFKTSVSLEPLRSNRRLGYADFKIQTGAVEEGKRMLSEITHDAPDFVPSWIRLAQVALAQGQLTNCTTLVAEALRRDADNYDAALLAARLKLASNKPDEAIAAYERLALVYKHSPVVFYQMGLAYLYKDDVSRALKNINQAIALDPTFDDAILIQAELNIRRDNPDAALGSLGDLIKRRPGQPLAYILTASAYIAKSEFEQAVATCYRLQKIYPRSPQVPVILGQLFVGQGKKEDARKAFSQALEFSPGFLPALEQLVNLDLSEQNGAAALELVNAAIDKTPQVPQLQVLLARVFVAQTNNDQAEQALQKAIALDANYRDPYMMLAKLYVHSKQNGKALQKLSDILANNPRDRGALMLMGMIQGEMQDYSAARSTYEKLIALDPNFAPALNNLAYLYSEKFHLLDQAFEMARKARDLNPNDPSLEDTLGWILYQRGEYSWALSLLQASGEKLASDPEVQFHLGMAYYSMDDEVHAAKVLGQVLKSDEQFVEKDQIKPRLAILAIDPRNSTSQALNDLEKFTHEHPDDVVACIKIGRVYEIQKSFAKAAEAYESALKQNPQNARLMAVLADLYSGKLNDPQRAFDLAKDAYKIAPDDGLVSHTLGRLVYARGDYKWALSLLQQSAQNLSPSAEQCSDLAWAYYSVGQTMNAQMAMRDVLKYDTNSPVADSARQFLMLTELSGEPDRAGEAEQKIHDILKADPTNGPALMAAGAASRAKGNIAAACDDYERVLVKYPDFLPAIRQLAILSVDNVGADEKGYEWATKAHTAMPEDNEVSTALGILDYRRGDFGSAVRLLNGVVQGKTVTHGAAFYYLGMAYYHSKDSRQAKSSLERAVTLDLPPQLTNEAKRVLSELK